MMNMTILIMIYNMMTMINNRLCRKTIRRKNGKHCSPTRWIWENRLKYTSRDIKEVCLTTIINNEFNKM